MQHREVIKAYSNKCSNILIQKFNFHYLRQAPKSFRRPAGNSNPRRVMTSTMFQIGFFHAQPKREKGLAADVLTGLGCLSSDAHQFWQQTPKNYFIKKQTNHQKEMLYKVH